TSLEWPKESSCPAQACVTGQRPKISLRSHEPTCERHLLAAEHAGRVPRVHDADGRCRSSMYHTRSPLENEKLDKLLPKPKNALRSPRHKHPNYPGATQFTVSRAVAYARSSAAANQENELQMWMPWQQLPRTIAHLITSTCV